MLRHIQNGDSAYWLIVTDVKNHEKYSAGFAIKREALIARISREYAFANQHCLGVSAGRVCAVPFEELVSMLRAHMDKTQPEIIYAPYYHDVHTDHQIAAMAVMSAAKAFRCGYVKKILMYETLSETDYAVAGGGFSPNVFIDIGPHMERKLEIAALYDGEILPPPFPRSLENIRALARFRGAAAHLEYAEAFMLVKEIMA